MKILNNMYCERHNSGERKNVVEHRCTKESKIINEAANDYCYGLFQEAENISEDVFTSLLKRYIMTKDQLEENGYPVKSH